MEMKTMATLARNPTACMVVVLVACILAGCSDNNGKKQKIRRLEGVAKTIDLEHNFVSMIRKDDKGNEIELKGTVNEDTVVLINGRSQKLADVRPGDKVVVYGFQKGSGTSKKLVATKVEVTRARDSDWKRPGESAAPPPPPVVRKPEQKPETAAQQKPATPTPAAGQGAQGPPSPSDEQRRAETNDLIYALIRVEMENAIEKRAELLTAGRERSDLEIRQLEGKIMRARDLLTDAGEVVDELDPPIVESAPKKQETPPKASEPAKTPPKADDPANKKEP